MVILLSLVNYPDGSGFKLKRFDIIIAVLAEVSVFGSLIWLFTRKNLLLRLGIMALVVAIRLSHNSGEGFVKDLAMLQPSGWVVNVHFLKYLLIVIPGTIAGDIILKMMKTDTQVINETFEKYKTGATFLALFMVGFIVLSPVTLYNRWVWQGFIGGITLCVASWVILKEMKGGYYDLLKEVFLWGTFWFILGFMLEPFEGGIKKDHSTISYYFLTSGLGLFFIIFASIIIDFFRKKSYLSLLIDSGQNPMIAYAGGNNIITPIIGIFGIQTLLNTWFTTPFLGFLRGFLFTLALAYIVKLFTKYKVFWRS
jgi:hypothetical protein